MKQDAKDRVMQAFASGEIHMLVSTTVVEVGVDVPNATVMVVEHAERFGLSQLHQLRGRVGRGAHQSHCILLYQYPMSEEAQERLKAMADTTDGFVIAERDLELRGPGDFFGTRQSGLPTLRTGDLLRDHALMEQARDEAARFVDEQTLAAPLVERMKAAVARVRFGSDGHRVSQMSVMRIIAGELKGRRLKTPKWDGLRPTSDKLRETLFNILAPRVAGARVLDGYAGTGAVGIEALSRGAAHVTFVDTDRARRHLIEENLRTAASRRAILLSGRRKPCRPGRSTWSCWIRRTTNPIRRPRLPRPSPCWRLAGCWCSSTRAAGRPGHVGRLRKTRDVASGDSALTFYTPGESGAEGHPDQS